VRAVHPVHERDKGASHQAVLVGHGKDELAILFQHLAHPQHYRSRVGEVLEHVERQHHLIAAILRADRHIAHQQVGVRDTPAGPRDRVLGDVDASNVKVLRQHSQEPAISTP